MRILHISDLHFGAHDQNLVQNLLDKAEAIKPDIILATGDLADQPTPENFQAAFAFLTELVERCNPPNPSNAPRLIVIPGNHDTKYYGNILFSRRHYDAATRDCITQHYFIEHNVWIYGMDSSSGRGIGATGTIRPEQFVAFQHAYHELHQQHGARFEQAFKIIALHHHPLPVKENAKLQRWLTLENAGTLLALALTRHIDLIVHGHEHVQARARFRSSLGGSHPSSGEVNVVSAGATLKQGETNWVNVITVGQDHSVTLDAYSSQPATAAFNEHPETHHIRPHGEAREKHFATQVKQNGYSIREAIFTAELNADGASINAVQLEDLRIQDATVATSKLTHLQLPNAKGHIDPAFLRVRGLRGGELGGLEFTNFANYTAQLDFGRNLYKEDHLSIEYTWTELDAFAMDEFQYEKKHGSTGNHMEAALFPITHPIEDLTLIVKFPDNFRRVHDYSLSTALAIRVLETDPANTQTPYELPALEADLREHGALRYIEALNLASLRIKRPPIGLLYGIAWKVPPLPPPKVGVLPEAGRTRIERVLAGFEKERHSATKPWKRRLTALLETLAKLFYERLIVGSKDRKWTGDLDLSIMIYNEKSEPPLLVEAGAIRYSDFEPERPTNHNGFNHFNQHFAYGAGVAGTAYKTNEYRLWVRIPARLRTTPDYYETRLTHLQHAVLLSMPLQNPHDERFPYGVINCGSTSDLCPLRDIGQSDDEKMALRNLQTSINQICLDIFQQAAEQYDFEI